MPSPRPFAQVDVSYREPFPCNPVVGLLEAEEIDDEEMLRIA